MCGIASFTMTRKAWASKQFDLEKAADALLTELDSRGRDACGIMAMNAQGALGVQKAAVRAFEFNKGRIPMNADTRAFAVHTRFATSGNKGFMRNNHPVQAGAAFVMHNGVVDDRELQRLQGHPEVDTFALAVKAHEHEAKREGETPRQHAKRVALAMAEIEGSAACIVAFQGTPMMISTKLTGSPLYLMSSHGVQIAASTQKAIEKCCDAIDLAIPTVTMLVKRKVKGQEVEVEEEFEDVDYQVEGEIAGWTPAGHFHSAVQVPKRSVEPKSWRRYFEKGETGEEAYGYAANKGSSSYQHTSGTRSSSHHVPWGAVETTITKREKVGDQERQITTRTFTSGAVVTAIYEYDAAKSDGNGKFISTTSTPPPKTDRDDEHFATLKDKYPDGTPWPPTSQQGQDFATHFSVWRGSQKGAKWARMMPGAAAAYDNTRQRTMSGTQPKLPFPSPSEVRAMLADPLDIAVSQALTKGVNISTMAQQAQVDLAGFKACPICEEQSDSFKHTPDGEMCDECERLWMWAEHLQR